MSKGGSFSWSSSSETTSLLTMWRDCIRLNFDRKHRPHTMATAIILRNNPIKTVNENNAMGKKTRPAVTTPNR